MMPRSARTAQVALALAVVATFVVAEWLRGVHQDTASAVSKGGWAGFAILLFWWLWEDDGLAGGLRRLGRLLALTAVAFGVLYLHYRRARLVDAGVEIDATFTFIGLGWFVGGLTPLTFAGPTVSFAQMPMQLLGHLPGYLIGFDRLGPFAIHLGIMLQVAALLALLALRVVRASLATQAGCVALAAGVFSNRLTLLLCNLTGYAIPSTAIGIMFLGLVLRPETFARTAPWVGGLLMLSLMHHYPGFFFVLPLVGLWAAAGPRPGRRIAIFVRANVPLLVVVAMAIACIALHPQLLLTRVRDVTTPSLQWADFRAHLAMNWDNLIHFFPAVFARTFFWKSDGSWHLLDLPPLGGVVAPIIATNWILTGVALRPRGSRFAVAFAALAACLVALTLAQHMLTNFENYRDMTLLVALTTVGVGFVLRVPEVGPRLRALLVAYAVVVAVVQYVDVAAAVGRRYGVEEYAPKEQATMESLRRYWRSTERPIGGELHVVVDRRFPLERLYLNAAERHGIMLTFTPAKEFCRDPRNGIEAATGGRCGRIAFAMRSTTCGRWLRKFGWPPAPRVHGVVVYEFEQPCDAGPPRDWSHPDVVELPLREE